MRAYDKLAGLNHIPYYDNTFGQDKFDVTIKLQENEVNILLQVYFFQIFCRRSI